MARTARTWKGARTPSALKRVRQSLRRRAVNRRTRSEAKTLVQQASEIALGRSDGDGADTATTSTAKKKTTASKTAQRKKVAASKASKAAAGKAADRPRTAAGKAKVAVTRASRDAAAARRRAKSTDEDGSQS